MSLLSLHQLIVSLGKAEKRYLRVYLSNQAIGNKSNYLDLLDAIERTADRSAVKRLMKGRLGDNHLSVTSHKLFELCLKALRNFHSASDPFIQLSDKLSHIRILFKKKLFDEALHVTRATLRKTESSADPQDVIFLLDWEMKILHAMVNVDGISSRRKQNFERKLILLRQIEQHARLQDYSYQQFIQLKTKWNTGIEQLDMHPGGYREKELMTDQAKVSYFQNRAANYFAQGKGMMASKDLEKLFIVFKNNKGLRQRYFSQYVATLNNLNVIYIEQGKSEKVERNIRLLQEIRTSNEEEKTRLQERIISAGLNLYNQTLDQEKARPIVQMAEDLIKKKKLSEIYSILFPLDIAIYYFYEGKFRQSLRMLTLILQRNELSLRSDIQKAARMFNLILHYELENTEYLLNLSKRTGKFFEAQNWIDPFAASLIGFFSKEVSATELHKLNYEMLKQKKDRVLKETYFVKFPFDAWIQAKLTGVSIKNALL